jgi:molecular chaperone GrpE
MNSSGNIPDPEATSETGEYRNSENGTRDGAPDAELCPESNGQEDSVEPVRVMKESEIAAIVRERDEYRDQVLRARAEFDNYRKRVLRDSDRNKQLAAETFVRGLLPVVDNLELAMQHADSASNALLKGVEMVYKQCQNVLHQFGVRSIEATGALFDPNVHEAVMHEESDDFPADTVANVFQRGYRMGDLVIRPARVAVSKGKRTSDGQHAARSTAATEDNNA